MKLHRSRLRFGCLALLWLAALVHEAKAQASPAAPLFQDLLQLGPPQSRTLRAHFWPAAADLGRPIKVFVLAVLASTGNPAYALTPQGWQPVRLGQAPLPALGPAITAGLSHAVELTRDSDLRGLEGTQLFVGYGVDGAADAAWVDMLGRQSYRQVGQLKSEAPPGAGSAQALPACPLDPAQPRFGSLPVALEDFIAFRPLGLQSVPIHMLPAKHGAFSMTALGATPVARPVRAPTPATVTEVWEVEFAKGNRNYQIFLHPCRELRLYFGHLVSLSPRLQAAFQASAPRCTAAAGGADVVRRCTRDDLNLPLQEGEVFASGPDSAGVDFGMLDFRRPAAAFVMPAHYDAYYPYYVAPLDYFRSDLAAQLATKTGSVLGTQRRNTSPLGGSHMQDLPGTAQGNWFRPGVYWANSPDASSFLSLAHDYVDPQQPLLAIGTNVAGLAAGLYAYPVRGSGLVNRDPADIRPDGRIHCLDSFIAGPSPGDMPLTQPAGVLLLRMANEAAMHLEFVPAASCAAAQPWAISGSASLFVR